MTLPTFRFLVKGAIAGALLAQPFAFFVWVGAEHGGRGLWTFPWAGMWGAILGVLLCLTLRLAHSLNRRIVGARTA
jgi:hypothetical protein